jgi:hypothetical protein
VYDLATVFDVVYADIAELYATEIYLPLPYVTVCQAAELESVPVVHVDPSVEYAALFDGPDATAT